MLNKTAKEAPKRRGSITTKSVCSEKDKDGNKKINQYIVLEELGRGAFAKVKLCVNTEDNKRYAMKIMDKKKLKKKFMGIGKSAYTNVEHEIAILTKLDHPNVVALYEVIDDPEWHKIYLVQDYIRCGSI